jgi:cutinase
VLCQGVGGAYKAAIADNVGGKGTSAAAIREGTSMFTKSVQKCPQHAIVFGGYSQGTAVMHNVVSKLPQNIKKQVVGGVLFGDTKNKQDKGQVPNYPKENVQIYCDPKDGVCFGSLNVTNGHFVYPLNGDIAKALAFLKGKINQAIGGNQKRDRVAMMA